VEPDSELQPMDDHPFSEAEEDDRPAEMVDDFLDDSENESGEDLFDDRLIRLNELMVVIIERIAKRITTKKNRQMRRNTQ
jgi:signal transduction histidine kinase